MKKVNKRGYESSGRVGDNGGSDIRCCCHRLIAVMEEGRIEFVCPRCKRKINIDFSGIASEKEIKKRITFA